MGKPPYGTDEARRSRLEEVPTERCAALLKAYLRRAPGARGHLPIDQDAPIEDFERVAPQFPVFRVRPY